MKSNIRLVILLLFASIMFVKSAYAQNFVHPGLPFTINDLERMKANRNSVSPWKESWNQIMSSNNASLNYSMQGPAEDVENKGNDGLYINDVTAMLYHALQWYFTKDEAHAELAISLIEPWAATHKTWSGTSAHLGAAWRGGTMAQACEILRYTYPGWTDELTILTEDYFETVFWPLFRLPNPLRAANQGANNLMGATYVAVYCNDQEKFDMCIDAFLNDACGGISNTLPNGQNGDTGRDQGHAMAMIGNLATVCEIGWAQGIDLYSVLENRLLAVHEYWCKYNLGNDVEYIGFGTCYDYYPTIGPDGRNPGASDAIPVTEMVYGAYAVRKGLDAPYVTQYRQNMGIDPNTFIFAKDPTFMTTAPFYQEPDPVLTTSSVTSLTGVNIGSVNATGSDTYSDETWTIDGAGSNVYGGGSDAFYYAYKQMSGDGSIIAKVNSLENTSSSAKAAVVIRESLAANSKMATMSLKPTSGSVYNSRGFDAADGNGSLSDGDVPVPFWIKIERRGVNIAGYVSPDGENWAAQQNTKFSMSDDYYVGLGVSSGSSNTLCTSVFTDVQLGVLGEDAENLGPYSQIEAESYTDSLGIETQVTSDESGNKDVYAINDGDWMEYTLYVPYSGTYTMDYRVSSTSASGDFILSTESDTLEQVTFAATGSADDWATVHSADPFYLTRGTQTIRLTANSDDWKINWMRLISDCKDVPIVSYIETIDDSGESSGDMLITDLTIFPGHTAVLKPTASTDGSWSWSGPNAFTSTERELTFEDLEVNNSGDYIVTFTNGCGLVNMDTISINVTDSLYFEAESYSSMEGVSVAITDDVSGGSHVTSIASGNWMEYEINVPVSALYHINYRIASELAGECTTSINGEDVEQISFEAGNWTTINNSLPVHLEAGIQTLRLTSNSDNWEINWIKLKAIQAVKPCSLPFEKEAFRIYKDSLYWTSGAMDITCETGVTFYTVIEAPGTLGAADYLNIYYKLDGGEKISLVEMSEATELAVYSTEELSASTIEIIVESKETSLAGYFDVLGIYVQKLKDPFSRIEAEDYDKKSGGSTESCSDTGGGLNVGSISDGNWLVYSGLNLAEVKSINARLAHKNSSEGRVEIRLGSETGTLVGTIKVPNTGNWQSWQTVSAEIESVVGIYDVYLVFSHPDYYVCNINWFEFSSERLLNTEAIVRSTVYTVNQTAKTITNIPIGISVSTFESNLVLSEGATVKTYQPDGVSEASEITDGCKVIVRAEDVRYTNTYTIEFLNSEATVTSTVYTVNQTNLTISNVPSGLAAILLKYNLVLAEGATMKVFEPDGTTLALYVTAGCKVLVTAEDGSNTNTYTVELATGIDDIANNEWLLYPNPVGDLLTIEGNLNSTIEIYNALGSKVLEDVLESEKHLISMKGLNNGIFIVRILSEGSTRTFRLIKK